MEQFILLSISVASARLAPLLDFVRTFWRYVIDTVQFLIVPPYVAVTIILLAGVAISLVFDRAIGHNVTKSTYWIAFAQFLCLPATLAIAATGPVDRLAVPYHPNQLGLWASNILFVVSLCLGAYWIWKMKSHRWFTTSVVLVQLWLLVVAGFVAGMALTGDWL